MENVAVSALDRAEGDDRFHSSLLAAWPEWGGAQDDQHTISNSRTCLFHCFRKMSCIVAIMQEVCLGLQEKLCDVSISWWLYTLSEALQ